MYLSSQVIITCQGEDEEDVLTNEDYDKLKKVIFLLYFLLKYICHLIFDKEIICKNVNPNLNLLTRSQGSQSMRLFKCGTTSR